MTIITTQAQIADASTADLIETVNALTGSSVTRFSSRAVGEVRAAQAILSAENRAGHEGVQKGSKPVARPLAQKKAAKPAESQETPAPAKAKTKAGKKTEASSMSHLADHVTKEKPAAVPVKAEKKTPGPTGDAAASISASWNDPETRAARSIKHKVKADGTEYNSVHAAFLALKLPLTKVIKFRLELKAAGKATFDGHKFTLVAAD